MYTYTFLKSTSLTTKTNNKTTKQQNLIHVHVHIPQKCFTNKKNKTTKSDTRMRTHSSKVLH